MARGFDQLTRAPRARVRGTKGSTSCPGRLGTWSEGLRCRPAIPGNSGPCPKASGLLQLSRGTRDRARGPWCQTALPGDTHFGPSSPRGRPEVLSDSGPCPRARGVRQLSRASRAWVRAPGVDQKSRMTLARVRRPLSSTCGPGRLGPVPDVPWVRSAVPNVSCPGPTACGFNQLSRATRSQVRGPTGLSRDPG